MVISEAALFINAHKLLEDGCLCFTFLVERQRKNVGSHVVFDVEVQETSVC